MSTEHAVRRQPLASGVAKKLLRANLAVVVFAVMAFALTIHHLSNTYTRSFLREQARLCAAALVPGPNGDLTESAQQLRERYGRLIAVATLDTVGNVHTVHPERPAYRRAALAVLADGASPTRMISPDTGARLSVAGVTVPLNGSTSPAAERVMILLSIDSFAGGWAGPTVIFAVTAASIGLVGVGLVRRWFDRQVTQPLRAIASAMATPSDGADALLTSGPGQWHETAEIAKRFAAILRNMAESEADATRMTCEIEHRLQQRERGYDQQLRRAKDQALLDPLTMLRNRSYLEEELETLFGRCHGEKGELAAIMFDIDNFKHYNDTYGHQVGDALLRFVGALLRGAIRPSDHAIRYGGDEFLLLLPDTDARQAAAVGERLVKLFGQYVTRLGRNHHLSMSAGVASVKCDSPQNGHELVARADAAMYAAKRKGKNGVAGPDQANARNESSKRAAGDVMPVARLNALRSPASIPR
jgi:diguanylate cyclase (GGDEF)-like protein